MRGARRLSFAALLAGLWMLIVCGTQAQPVLVQQIISREYSIHVGGIQTPEYKAVISREVTLFVGDEPVPPLKQAVSREVSIAVTTPAVPTKVSPLIVTATPTGETVTLSWAGYNQWAQGDVARYDIYMSTHGFTNVSQMTRYTWVPGETFSIMLTNLPPWEDHCFAVVPVDALGGFDPVVNYAAAYVIAREVASREFSVFVGDEPSPPLKQAVSREVSIVVSTPAPPTAVANLTVTSIPTGESVALSWSGYNQWAEQDVARYDIFMSTHGFTDVSQMSRYASVPGETFSITFTNLPAWEDHAFAVVPVDALGGFDPTVTYAAAYIIARELVSREFSVFVGDEPSPPLRHVVSREFSIVVTTTNVPAPVTCLGCGFMARDSVDFFSAIDLDWTAYNDVGQQDVARYRVYLGPAYYDSVAGLEPFAYVPAETKQWTLTGLDPYGIYFVAVVAEDALGQFDPVVRSQSAQASVDRVREVRNLASVCGTNWLAFSWLPPDGADPHTNNLLAAYHLYLAGAATPVVLDRFTVSHTATNLLAGHGYPVLLTTMDNLGRESDGASALAATLVPNPAETVVNSFYGITRVAWERVEPEEVIERFSVYMAETNFNSVAGITVAQTTRGHSADFVGLIEGKPYYFAVTTVNIAGCESLDLPVRTVVVVPSATAPTELEVGGFSDGTLSLHVDGPRGADYVLLGSPDLENWFPLSTNTPPIVPFTIVWPAGSEPCQFYRLLIR